LGTPKKTGALGKMAKSYKDVMIESEGQFAYYTPSK